MTAVQDLHTTFIGIGSNLGDPLVQVQRALEELAALPHCRLVQRSPWYLSKAIGPGDQPDYINGVAELGTNMNPEALLDALQAIEAAHDRVRQERWGPRTLDLDILLYSDCTITSERLQVPHPWLKRRSFVILPLADVAPGLILPDGTCIDELAQTISRDGITRLHHEHEID